MTESQTAVAGAGTRAELELALIEETLRASEFRAVGGSFEERLAAATWLTTGFGRNDVADWVGARCFSPTAALRLRDAGVTPQHAARIAHTGGSADTLGYLYSRRSITLAEALEAAGGAHN